MERHDGRTRGEGPRVEAPELVGESSTWREVREALPRIAESELPVLVLGETGTGKELVARALHALSPRNRRSFVAHNCGATPDSLIESELFGHARGAFTGAVTDRIGLFEAADQGTLFLDEIGDASALLQMKLLRVLQEGEARRVGTRRSEARCRVVSATPWAGGRRSRRFRRRSLRTLCVFGCRPARAWAGHPHPRAPLRRASAARRAASRRKCRRRSHARSCAIDGRATCASSTTAVPMRYA
jgi:transcriptional regulator with GAF, ATPase, and Fis domain